MYAIKYGALCCVQRFVQSGNSCHFVSINWKYMWCWQKSYEEMQGHVLSWRSDDFAHDIIRWRYDNYWEHSTGKTNCHLNFFLSNELVFFNQSILRSSPWTDRLVLCTARRFVQSTISCHLCWQVYLHRYCRKICGNFVCSDAFSYNSGRNF